ncbi:DUF1850 domain-containing protein [Pseudalkalibacillus berkeleyi]|uniref:DUF1850 domain-containing protein n=1 Tax=Pseudalkalibacillus berkeleyi TaxID=1069813 RepID=A0ABS9H4Y3_9BACL|nr:DUF1850 domain-containing protein [Pseudalkalibacillus berkeleyi]MCF6138981.1 DUF1850 domain-containing protein [Pseudalkalibacillus berkeleyi]
MKRYQVLIIISVLGFTLIGLTYVPYGQVLSIEYENSGDVLVYTDVEHGTEFEVEYTHSVHRTPVIEYYEVNNLSEIVQTDLAYENFAIGMPSNATGEEKFIVKDGVYYITDMNRVFSHVDLRTGQVIADHSLKVGQKQIQLKDWIEPGTWIRLKVRPISLWQRLKGDDIHG